MRTRGESRLQAKDRGFTKNQPCQHLDRGLLPPKLCGNKLLSFKRPPTAQVCGLLPQQPELPRTAFPGAIPLSTVYHRAPCPHRGARTDPCPRGTCRHRHQHTPGLPGEVSLAPAGAGSQPGRPQKQASSLIPTAGTGSASLQPRPSQRSRSSGMSHTPHPLTCRVAEGVQPSEWELSCL